MNGFPAPRNKAGTVAEFLALCMGDNSTNCTLGQIRHTWRQRDTERVREKEGERDAWSSTGSGFN